MGFGIRVMPGVRLSASSRGLRAGVGPRAARVNFGTGRTTVSSGVGPVSIWTPVTSGARRSSRGHTSMSAYQRQVRAAERQAQEDERRREIEKLRALIHSMTTAHLERFTETARPEVALMDVDSDEVESRLRDRLHRRSSTRGSRLPKHLRPLLEDSVALEVHRLRAVAEADRRSTQLAVDAAYSRLLSNDPGEVIAALDAAFEDNGCPSVPIDVEGGEATVLLLFDHPTELPDRHPDVTPTGKPTLKRWNQTEAAEFYLHVLASNLLATAKEAFAVAPSLGSVCLVALRREPVYDGAAHSRLQPIFMGSIARDVNDRLDWANCYPPEVIDAIPGRLLRRAGRAKRVEPLDISAEPDLAVVVQQAESALSGTPST